MSDVTDAADRIERHFIGQMSPDIRTVIKAARERDLLAAQLDVLKRLVVARGGAVGDRNASDRETAYLLGTAANAEHLRQALQQMGESEAATHDQ